MPRFVITTHETVEGRYLVEAPDAAAAQAAFEAAPTKVGEQLGYQAFDVEVRRVEDDDDRNCDCLIPALEGAGQHSPGCACLRNHVVESGAVDRDQ